MDFETNTLADVSGEWVRVGGGVVGDVFGDADRYVKTTGAKVAYWRPDRSWGGQTVTDGRIRAVVTAWATNAPPEYMAVDLENDCLVSYYSDKEAVPGSVGDDMYKTRKLLMRKVPAAGVPWTMGSSIYEEYRSENETPHRVTLSDDFYIGVYEVTRGQWAYCGLADPSEFSWPGRSMMLPLHKADYRNVRGTDKIFMRTGSEVGSGTFLDWVRKHAGVAVDLPTSAQWEFACRAGKGGAVYQGYFGSKDTSQSIADMKRIAWFADNSSEGCDGAQVHEVGLKEPNAFGLYDMIGNVSEWCLDFYSNTYYANSPELDPHGPAACELGQDFLIQRGSGYNRAWNGMRIARFDGDLPWGQSNVYGFRVCAPAVAY
ncbi:MAG: formylglycine-generating enzyme family protein [Kiritimatiellae bacterium]|nr:formylglycine-generating enzyme family protein [Kiritimatiellia bacterium]